jgi:hypothetical protein
MLNIFWILGLYTVRKNEKLRYLYYFSLLGVIGLIPVYNRINPEMERYFTHLIPFLIIPATYGLARVIEVSKKYKLLFAAVFLLTFYQLYLSYSGLKNRDGGSWQRLNYQDKIALKIKDKVPKGSILLTSFPEPYFLVIGNSAQGVYDTPPFIHLDESYDSKNLFIINDMGMRDQFPNFSVFVSNNLKPYKTGEYQINENYHYQNRVEAEKYPVEVYQIKVGDIRKIIAGTID